MIFNEYSWYLVVLSCIQIVELVELDFQMCIMFCIQLSTSAFCVFVGDGRARNIVFQDLVLSQHRANANSTSVLILIK